MQTGEVPHDYKTSYRRLQKVTFVATDQGPVVQSALLRGELVRLRRESGLTQEQVASALEWSPSKLIRVEGGRSSITKVDLDALLASMELPRRASASGSTLLNRGARGGLVG